MGRPESRHDRLGALRQSKEGDCWEATVPVGDTEIVFEIGGGKAPDDELLAHAVDIFDDYPAFRDAIERFLETETARLPQFAEEIRALEIDTVSIVWPRRPDDGMIYFSGDDSHRVWRCDYVDRKPCHLGFDD